MKINGTDENREGNIKIHNGDHWRGFKHEKQNYYHYHHCY